MLQKYITLIKALYLLVSVLQTGGEEREEVEETLILEILAGGGKVSLVIYYIL